MKKAIFDDVIEISVDGEQKKFLLVRQFCDFQKLIIRITTTNGVITDIRITADTAYTNTDFKGLAFRFPTVSDFYRFAKSADEKFALCLQPIIDNGDCVKDEVLVDSILKYFDDPNINVYGKFYAWESETRYIHQSGVKIGTYNNVVWLKQGIFHPSKGYMAKVRVEYDLDVLIGMNIFVDHSDPGGNPLYHIEERLVVSDVRASYSLQKALKADPGSVYDKLEAAFAPFDAKNIASFRDFLHSHDVEYEYNEYRQHVDLSVMQHIIPVSEDRNVVEVNGYVLYGSRRDFYILISYVDEIVVKVEFDDRSVTSGYWHDNQNYPYSDISSKKVSIAEQAQIKQLALSLGVDEVTPDSLMAKMKADFLTQDDFIKYLDAHNIAYSIEE